MRDLTSRLKGGDLRSIGAADTIAAEAIKDPALVASLISAIGSTEPVVRMRSADALEKATRVKPEYLQPYADHLLSLLSAPQPKEVLWHILQMMSRVHWARDQERVIFPVVEHCLSNGSSIVKTCAMQALADLAFQFPRHLGRVAALLGSLSVSGTPAMRSRGAKLLLSLRRANPSLRRAASGGR